LKGNFALDLSCKQCTRAKNKVKKVSEFKTSTVGQNKINLTTVWEPESIFEGETACTGRLAKRKQVHTVQRHICRYGEC